MTDNVEPMSAKSEIEEGLTLAPRFDADGLITCVATDASSGAVLMVAHMNQEALTRTIETGEAPTAKVINIMDALKKSVKAQGKQAAPAKAQGKRAAASRSAAKKTSRAAPKRKSA